MQLVITGGNGFLAKQICKQVLRRGVLNVQGEIQNVEKSKSRVEQDSDELETNPKSAKIRRISHEKDDSKIDSRKISRDSIHDDREMDYLAEKDPLQELFREVESQFDEQIQKSKKTAVDAKGL